MLKINKQTKLLNIKIKTIKIVFLFFLNKKKINITNIKTNFHDIYSETKVVQNFNISKK